MLEHTKTRNKINSILQSTYFAPFSLYVPAARHSTDRRHNTTQKFTIHTSEKMNFVYTDVVKKVSSNTMFVNRRPHSHSRTGIMCSSCYCVQMLLFIRNPNISALYCRLRSIFGFGYDEDSFIVPKSKFE